MIDTSMYGKAGAPDFLGGVERGMRLKDMLGQQKLADQEKELRAKYTTQNEDGSTSFDQGAFAKDLAGINPDRAHALQKQMHEQSQMAQESELQRWGNIATLASSANPENWAQIRGEAIAKGYASETDLPQFFDQGFVKSIGNRALTQAQRLSQANTDREFGLKERAMNQKSSQPKLTPAQEAIDKGYSKEYHDWTAGGRSSAQTEIAKLRGVAESLKDGGGLTTGGLTGTLPDRFTSNKVLSARADVQSTIMNSLRAILGAQFTEKEGERVIKNTWNEADSTANNLARVQRLAQDLEAQAAAKDQKAAHFENSGSLVGFSPVSSSRANARRSDSQRSGGNSASWGVMPEANAAPQKTFKTNEIEW